MSHSRPRLPIHALTTSALFAVLMSVCACAGMSAPGAASSSHASGGATAPAFVVRSATIQVPSSASRTQVSASCRFGEQMIGGGFSSSDTFEYDAKIAASYPSSATTWTAAAAPSSAFVLEVEAYCLPASPTLGVKIVQAPIAPVGAVSCPAGLIMLSGGFQGAGPVSTSRLDGNGWYAGLDYSTGLVYALCATQHVGAGSSGAAATFNPHSSAHNYNPASESVTCPIGERATSGGFSGGSLILSSASAGAPYDTWTITAGGDGDATVYARCVTITT